MYEFVITELFSLALTVETLQAEICRRERFLKGGGSLRLPTKGGRGRRPPTTVEWQKTRRIALSCGIKNIAGRFFGLVTKTDGWTDRQNYDSQDRASIAWRGKNGSAKLVFLGCLKLADSHSRYRSENAFHRNSSLIPQQVILQRQQIFQTRGVSMFKQKVHIFPKFYY